MFYFIHLLSLLLLGPVSVVGMLQGEVLDQRNPPLPSQTFKNLQNANCFSRTNLQNAKCFSLVSFQMFVKAKYKFNGKSEHYLGEQLRERFAKFLKILSEREAGELAFDISLNNLPK